MREFFGSADEKFVKYTKVKPIKAHPLQQYKFDGKAFEASHETKFDRNALPIEFRVTPDTLLNLCTQVVDAFPLPKVYKWTNVEVCKWIREYGYPHYMNTFRVNLITGRKLLLLNAQALSAMNIKNFAHIKHIAYGIRELFFYEMSKYIRSISLPTEYYSELYKLFQVNSGRKYEDVRRSDLWRRMQLIRKQSPNYSHWELLERWLARECAESPELFGQTRRFALYRCKPETVSAADVMAPPKPCNCMPPCSCYLTAIHLRSSAMVFTLLKPNREADPLVGVQEQMRGSKCDFGPGTRHGPSHSHKFGMVLTCLKQNFGAKYGVRRK